MALFEIPGFGEFNIVHLVFDFNGTLACDGRLIHRVYGQLMKLAEQFQIHVITADTFGKAKRELEGIPCHFSVLSTQDQALQKEAYVKQIGAHQTIALGNGRNDRLMLSEAAIGIAILQTEGAASEAVLNANIIVTSILDALGLIRYPLRLKATLRS